MRTRPYPALLSAALLLSGCTLGPNFVPPEAQNVSSYTGAGDAPMPVDQQLALGKPADTAWWKQFRSPVLDGLIAQAAAGSRDLAAAKARLAQAKEQIIAAKAALLPQLSLAGEIGEQDYSLGLQNLQTALTSVLPPFTFYAVQPTASFPLDIFGGSKRAVERAKALTDYETYELKAAYLTLYANIAADAFRNAGARAQITNLQDVIAGDQRNVTLVQTEIGAGSGTRTQLLSVQSQLSEDRTLIPDFAQEEALSRHALAVLTGQAVGNWTMPALSLDDFTLPEEIPAGLPSELIHQRPDILAAEAQLHMASAAIGIATANLYPQLTLSASLTRDALSPASLFTTTPNLWTIAAEVTGPLFDGGKLSAERRTAIQAYQAALADYEKTVLAAFGQVADDLQALVTDAERVTAEKNAAQTSADALDLARQSFAAGNSGILDVIDAERRYAEAKLGASRAQEARLQHTVQLYVALGGVEVPDVGPEPASDAGKPCCSY
jgi:NodT family efflux transporter outer membrane factor (OMF) lipoprotein